MNDRAPIWQVHGLRPARPAEPLPFDGSDEDDAAARRWLARERVAVEALLAEYVGTTAPEVWSRLHSIVGRREG